MDKLININEIRILPMDKTEEFKSDKSVRKFLLNDLKEIDVYIAIENVV